MGFSFLVYSPELVLHPAEGTQGHRDALIAGFMVLQIFGGHVGMGLVLLTVVFSKKVQRRNPILLSFLVSWFLYATSFTLLLYSGKQTGPEPPIHLCLVQAGLVYGTPVMTSAAGLAFVLYLWLSLENGSSLSATSGRAGRWCFMLLLTSPYLLFLVFSTAMVVLGSRNPAVVSRSRYLFYCTINLPSVNAVPGTSAFIMFMVLVFEVLTALKLYRHYKVFKTLRRTADNGPPLHLFVRIGIFSGYSLLALVGCITFWSSIGDNLPYIIQASLPTAAFLIFGTQEDLLRVWGVTAAVKFLFRPFVPRSLGSPTHSAEFPRNEENGMNHGLEIHVDKVVEIV
ncbi:hypothetical protein C8R47DRAFT_1324809 [Mycena vitilis]|nr:hypothetical protein C8R47DRAFT_1330144 [Mycena vitilis]KAJ6472203.1 hypothetical protein C8R47DRAFT_1324809 [Mycena vitilis]